MEVVYLIVGVLCGIAGYQSCERKGHDVWLGAALGFFLGLIGLIIVGTFRDRRTPIAMSPQGPYGQQQAVAVPQQAYVAPTGQRYVAPIVPQYVAPQPQPPAGPQPH